MITGWHRDRLGGYRFQGHSTAGGGSDTDCKKAKWEKDIII